MRRLFCSAVLLGLTVTCNAQVRGGIADVAVIDRDSGAVLSPHYYRGEYWVAGRPGARYSIQIRNRLGERLLAVTSVDGVNVVSGATAGWDQTGYVFGPGESYQITGWRKTDAEVAAFTFTESANSYAERTGRPGNVGVIGVAIFRERRQEPAYTPPAIARPDMAQPLDKAQARRARRAAHRAPRSRTPEWPRCRDPMRRPMWRCAGAQARHGSRRARILVRQSHGIYENADSAERGDSHPLRQLGAIVRHGHRQAAAPGVADGESVPGIAGRAVRAGSCGIIRGRTAIMQ